MKGGRRVRVYILACLYLQVATGREWGKAWMGMGWEQELSVFTFLYTVVRVFCTI